VKAAATIVVVLLVSGWLWTKHARAVNEHALAAVASRLAGRPVHVHCETWIAQLVDVSANSGEVWFDQYGHPADSTHLTRSTCGLLDRFRAESTHPEIACLLAVDWSRWSYGRDSGDTCARRAHGTAEAINTLTHESMHLRGVRAEALAQCNAIKNDARTTVQLGGTQQEGQAVASFILALQPGMPTEYQFAAGAC